MDILTRIIARAAVLSACAAACCPRPVAAQISPGKLAEPHAFLEGIGNCLKCHDLGEGPSAEKCMDCHREIRAAVDSGRGLHHAAVTVEGRECLECHREHAGRGFQLVHWPGGVTNFDHERTGYGLLGKHARLDCRDCHRPDLIVADLKAFGDQVNLSRTYLGLGTECLGCHVDAHVGQLGRDCTKCHGQDVWKPASGFDHARTRYPLTGRHAGVECGRCHPTVAWDSPPPESVARYANLSFGQCSACHRDVHQGGLGPDCAGCHNTSGWMDIAAGSFDHDRTGFPLRGRHRGLACESCHRPGEKKAGLAHGLCTDCHADVHRSQFAARADGGRCESCHHVDGFVPALFTTADHAGTRFPLEGAHLAQPCVACHRPVADGRGETYLAFTFEDRACTACHVDPHHGQFARGTAAKACTVCHGTSAWLPVDFDHDRDSTYRLEGRHRSVPCIKCHVPVTEDGVTFVRYKPLDPACRTCHTVATPGLDGSERGSS